jgi:hypothetical protein
MNLRLARRKDCLERINRQLGEFYGPLHALNMAAMRAWTELQQRHALWGADVFFTEAEADAMPRFTAAEAETWRLWMTDVFMPLNRRMVEIVVNHADLLIETSIPQCLQDLCAHVVCFEAVLGRWQAEESPSSERCDNKSVILFPETLAPYVEDRFIRLKRDQARLLARSAK